jgi:alpha-1,3/alpha-1,6-mannosyltransferase
MCTFLVTINTFNTNTKSGPIVSLNRFERKKNIALALEAFAAVRRELSARGSPVTDKAAAQAMRLVIAGGCLCV